MSADNLLACNTISRWHHVAASVYCLCSCVPHRWLHSVQTFHSFVSWFPAFNRWMLFVTLGCVCPACREDMVQSGKFSKTVKNNTAPLVHFSVSSEKRRDPRNVPANDALTTLIDWLRTDEPMFFLNRGLFSGAILNTAKTAHMPCKCVTAQCLTFGSAY